MTHSQLNNEFGRAKDAKSRSKIANELLGRGDLKDKTVAKNKSEVPKVDNNYPSPREIGSKGKNAVFLDSNGTYSIGPIVNTPSNGYVTGTFGMVRNVKPEFAN